MDLQYIQNQVHQCNRCARLRSYCAQIQYDYGKDYWAKPVPGFGCPDAKLIIIGLAPSAHGANKTGRVFTYDESGIWLYRALHVFGFSTQPTSYHAGDALKLINTYITCAVKCAPPQNKPTAEEKKMCFDYLSQELTALQDARIYLALGKIAFEALLKYFQIQAPFGHHQKKELDNKKILISSYHPSPQNTKTGRLSQTMWNDLFQDIQALL